RRDRPPAARRPARRQPPVSGDEARALRPRPAGAAPRPARGPRPGSGGLMAAAEVSQVPGITGERFREVMAQVPTAVCVVAADHADGPAGLSVGSFVSVSLDPPLVGVFVATTSTRWPRVAEAG